MRFSQSSSESSALGSHLSEGDDDWPSHIGCCERLVSRCVLGPGTKKRLVWEIIGMFLIVYDLITIPLQAFGEHMVENGFLDFMSWFASCYWVVDIPFSFFVGFDTKDGMVELRPRRIAQNYMQSWFPFDLVVVSADCSIKVTEVMAQSSDVPSYSGLMRILRILRMIRLLRLLKVQGVMGGVLDRIKSESVLIFFQLGKIIIYILLLNHVIACMWYLIGGADGGWIEIQGLDAQPDLS